MRYATETMPGAVKAGTGKRYLVSFRQVYEHLKGLAVDQIGPPTVAALISSRKKAAPAGQGAPRRGATNATVRRDLTAVSAVLEDCQTRGEITQNAARDFNKRQLKEQRDPIRPPSAEMVAEMVARCPGNFARCVRFLDQTGMRAEEAATLEWRECDKLARTVTLIKTKTNSPRTITLNDEAFEILWNTPRHTTGKYVFWQGEGLPYKNFSSRFASINAGNPGGRRGKAPKPDLEFRCHDIRHGFAIRWLREGGDIYKLSRHLGHKSVKTTEIYLGHVASKR